MATGGDITLAMDKESLGPRAQAGDDEAIHDLAVIRHAAAIADGPEHVERWEDALESWSQLLECEPFWKRMELRADALADARATNGVVESTRLELPALLLGPSTEVAAISLDQGNAALAADHLFVVLHSRFPESAVRRARGLATERPRAHIKDLMSAMGHCIERDLAAGWLPLAALDSAWRSARDDLIPAANRLLAADPTGPEVKAAADEVAEFLRGLSVRLHNQADAAPAALEPLRAAQGLASSQGLKERIAGDLVALQFNIAMPDAFAHAQSGDLEAARISAQRARETATEEEQRRQADNFIAQIRTARLQHGRTLPRIPGWAVAVGIFAIIAIARAGLSSSGGSSSGARSTSPATQVRASNPAPGSQGSGNSMPSGGSAPAPRNAGSSTSRDQLAKQVDSLQSELESEREEMDSASRSLETRRQDLDSQEARLNQLQNQYRISGAPPSVVSEYESLRRQFNGAVDSYNFDLDRYRRRSTEFNQRVEEYNGLVERLRNTR